MNGPNKRGQGRFIFQRASTQKIFDPGPFNCSCENPVTVYFGGKCSPKDMMCKGVLGEQGPLQAVSMVVDWKCLLITGSLAKPAVTLTVNAAAGKAVAWGDAASMGAKGALGQTTGSLVSAGGKIVKSPWTTAVFLPFAVKELLEKCECHKL